MEYAIRVQIYSEDKGGNCTLYYVGKSAKKVEYVFPTRGNAKIYRTLQSAEKRLKEVERDLESKELVYEANVICL